MTREIHDEAERVVERHVKWFRRDALRQVENEMNRVDGRSAAFSKVAVEDANWALEDLDLTQEKKTGLRFWRKGADIHTEEVETPPVKVPVRRGDPGDINSFLKR